MAKFKFLFQNLKIGSNQKRLKKGSTRDWRSRAEKRGKLAAKTWPHVLWSKTIRPMDIWMNKRRVDGMVKRIFCIFMIIEGTTEIVLLSIMPLKPIYSQNLGFVEHKNVFLNTTERSKL